MMFVVCQLQEMGQRQGVPLYMSFVELTKACDCVDRTLFCAVFQRFVVQLA